MKANEILSRFTSILSKTYKNTPQHILEECQNGKAIMSLPIDAIGCQFISYSFDTPKTDNPNCTAFPFFAAKAGVRSMCDYILFCMSDGQLFVLLLELKLAQRQTMPQLRAGYCFAKYLIDTFNRLENYNLQPQYRLVSISKSNFVKKGSTKMKDVKYDKDNFCIFEGRTFVIKEFLK